MNAINKQYLSQAARMRWVDMHAVEFHFSAKIHLAVHQAIAALRAGNLVVFIVSISRAASMFRASAIAVKTASNIDPAVYQEVIRPHMAAFSTKLSGAGLPDHRLVRAAVKALGAEIETTPDHLDVSAATAVMGLVLAIEAWGAEHIRSATAAVGESPSLVATGRKNAKPVGKVIAELNARRVRDLLDPLRRALAAVDGE